MRVIFMGTPEFARVVFIQLCEKYEIVAVCTQPDKPVGRKQILTPPPVKLAALARGIPVLQPQKLDSSVSEKLARLGAEAIIVVAYGKILPESILHIAPCINLHASILPAYRGASPIQQMILSDDREYGISIMRMDSGLDSGEILAIETMPRDDRATYTIVSQNLARLGGDTLCEVLAKLGEITPVPQDHSKATYCKKISKQDGLVDFSSARLVYKKWLAFNEWPGVYLTSGLKLFDIDLLRYSEAISQDLNKELATKGGLAGAGEICHIEPCVIACGDGECLVIGELQAPSKNRVNASVFLRSRGLQVGDKLC